MNNGGWVALLAGAGIALYLIADESGLQVKLEQQPVLPPPPEQMMGAVEAVDLESIPVTMPAPPPFVPVQMTAAKTAVEQPLQLTPLKAVEPKRPEEMVKVEPLKPEKPSDTQQQQAEPVVVDEKREAADKEEMVKQQSEQQMVSLEERQRDREEQADGRVKLKAMELGKGPQIRIDWPNNQQAQQQLQQWLGRCAGMETALINEQGDLFVADGARGERWELNLDRYSGFVRELGRGNRLLDKSAVASIHRHHGSVVRGTFPVVVFSRAVDAQLLGGVGRIAGEHYMEAKQIRASYQMEGGVPVVADFEVDGVGFPGEVALRVWNRVRCR